MKKDLNPKDKGLYTDTTIENQPKGSHRFALNMVNESIEGDQGSKVNEEANEIFTSLKPGFIPIGKCYIGDNKTAIFSVSQDNTVSEIGILNDNYTYETHVNDADTTDEKDKLGFRITHQIDATYRLRRGCERVVYFTDDLNPPRFYNFEKDYNFKSGGEFVQNKFSLIRSYENIPQIDNVEILEGSGNLKSGSYSFMFQYLDEDFNPSSTVTEINNVNIYRDSVNQTYYNIGGSSADETSELSDGSPTGKAISVKYKNFDDNYLFYRLIIIQYTSGTGEITSVKATDPLSTENDTFVYDGNNATVDFSQNEIATIENDFAIERASHIDQIDNTLILANTKGSEAKFCRLQKYASRIKADCTVKKVSLLDVYDENNPKNPVVNYNGLSYQPGEVYSFGIVYLFEDNTVSPVYHIPGKAPGESLKNMIFDNTPSDALQGVYPMSNENNDNESNTYTDRSCTGNFWGLDSEGNNLLNQPIRHHKFPTRNELGIGFVEKQEGEELDDLQVKTLGVTSIVDSFKEIPEGYNYSFPYSLAIEYKKTNSDTNIEYIRPFEIVEPVSDIIERIGINDNLEVFKVYFSEFVNGQNQRVTSLGYLYDLNTTADIERTYANGGILQELAKGYFPFTHTDDGSPNGVITLGTVDDVSSLRTVVDNSGSNYAILYKFKFFLSSEKFYGDNLGNYEGYYFGIRFSGIDIPSEEEIGKKVKGYYIVRNERTDSNSTILDSGVVFPVTPHQKFRSASMLMPQYDGNELINTWEENNRKYKVSDDTFSLLTMSHKYQDKTNDNFTTLEEQGVFRFVEDRESGIAIQDVQGEPYKGDNLGRTSDNDGLSLRMATQFSIVNYANTTDNNRSFFIENKGLTAYNLNAVEKGIHPDDQTEIWNLAANEKALIFCKEQLSQRERDGIQFYKPGKKELPYVYLKKNNRSFYNNFRQLPYYKQHEQYFDITDSSVDIMQGDIYVSPFRYSIQTPVGGRAGTRRERASLWEVIGGIVLAIVGVVVSVFSTGVLAIAGGALVAAGGLLMTGSAIVKAEAINEAFDEKWNKGLDKTVYDDFFWKYFDNPIIARQFGLAGGSITAGDDSMWDDDYTVSTWDKVRMRDDTLFWRNSVVADLWFETKINIGLHTELTDKRFSPLTPFSQYMEDKEIPTLANYGSWGFNNQWFDGHDYIFVNDTELLPQTKEDRFFLNKLCQIRSSQEEQLRDRTWEIKSFSTPTLYAINGDYLVNNKIKQYYHLPIEYDCCSDCNEEFTHRYYYSEQSFSEELIDNYKTFKPNNYKDIHGETGDIKDIFVFNNNLYIHTEEALWLQPRNHQERVTDQVVSFIGTGSYFSLPPQRIIDDATGMSAGTQHKWSNLKTPYGVFFVSENEGKIYKFDGKLKPISEIGNSNWFQNNVPINIDRQYLRNNNKKYPFDDNPSNLFGSGFIMTYDSTKDRIITTKKDIIFSDEVGNQVGYDLCVNDNNLTIFLNVEQTKEQQQALGWTFENIENCRMKFSREVQRTKTEVRNTVTTITVPPNTVVVPFFDTTSMTASTITNISNTLDAWFPNFKASVNGGNNNITLVNPGTWNRWSTEDWLETPQIALNNIGQNKDVLLLVFVDETNGPGTYHGGALTNPMSAPTQGYINDVTNFVNTLYPQFASFTAINYPIQINKAEDKEYLQHTIAAIEARNMTQAEVDALTQNANWTNAEWSILKSNLQSNPYVGQPILKDYGWLYKEDRVDGVDNNGTPECPVDGISVITPCQFERDIVGLLNGSTTTTIEEVEVTVPYLETEYNYIDGEIVENPVQLDSSWTMSFSLKRNEWQSWHSYMPNFYVNVPEKFYSWRYGNNNFWKHNVKGKFHEFYGVEYPHIIEYVSIANPTETKIWNHIRVNTKASIYDKQLDEYYEDRDTTFNKVVLYNDRQCSGELNLLVKEEQSLEDWFSTQVVDRNNNDIIIDRVEEDWLINDFRDIRTNYNTPIWNSNLNARQDNYYIDKILNVNSLNLEKDWTQLESFRDKHLVVRFIFDKFANRKLVTNFTEEDEQKSYFK